MTYSEAARRFENERLKVELARAEKAWRETDCSKSMWGWLFTPSDKPEYMIRWSNYLGTQ